MSGRNPPRIEAHFFTDLIDPLSRFIIQLILLHRVSGCPPSYAKLDAEFYKPIVRSYAKDRHVTFQ
jgi:hypothetical protein